MKYPGIVLIVFLPFISFAQEIPYNLNPDWQSTPLSQVATGLGLADINGDGWKDIIVANGNDQARQKLVVYYNNGDGTFPLAPSWQSSDVDYHGHLAVGDINKDGWNDVAVSVYLGPSGFGSPGKVKVYYNQGGQLESSPSFVSDPFYTFSCALGDADADGDLDLAVACGEPYHNIIDKGRIFINNNGLFTNVDVWESAIDIGAADVEFADMDGNGFTDVVFVCEPNRSYIFLASNSGYIQSAPAWQTAESSLFINSVDIGTLQAGQLPCMVMTGNDQHGGDGKIRQYIFSLPFPEASYAAWTSMYIGYGSGILLADVTRDDTLDLIYGGWWLPMEILVGNGVDFATVPAYTSNTASVVEAIQMADLGQEGLVGDIDTITIQQLEAAVVTLQHQIIEEIRYVMINNVLIDPANYSSLPNRNLVFFKNRLFQGDQVTIAYKYCLDGDIVITNWDSNVGNYIFYNTNSPVGIKDINAAAGDVWTSDIYPNPASKEISLKYGIINDSYIIVSIADMTGYTVKVISEGFKKSGEYDIKYDVSDLTEGCFLVNFSAGEVFICKKLIIMH
ncbi:MAG: T9SS type A sorting domain-containing protein [Bacteroidetes bacterium]|nr:T9SS type A sorting domain-containing protein [Bacteroidota bacterium]